MFTLQPRLILMKLHPKQEFLSTLKLHKQPPSQYQKTKPIPKLDNIQHHCFSGMLYLLLAIYLSYVTVDNTHSFKSDTPTMGGCMSQEKVGKRDDRYERTIGMAEPTKPQRQPVIHQIQHKLQQKLQEFSVKKLQDLTGVKLQNPQPRVQQKQKQIQRQRLIQKQRQIQKQIQRQRQDRTIPKDDQLFQHPSNPHRDYFQTTSTSTGTKIVFTSFPDTSCYNCIKKQVIPPNKVTIYKIKQTKTLKQHVFVGITTESILTSPKNWRETIAFCSNSGSIWQNGSWHQAKGAKVKDGQTIIVQVDTTKWLVNWRLDDSREWSSPIPEKMKDKYLFLSLMMHDKGDTIQVLK